MDERARLIELEHRRRRDTAVGLRRRIVGAGESFVGPQAARALHDVEVITPIDGEPADWADGPRLRQRLRERRVVLEDRNLHIRRLPGEVSRSGPADRTSHGNRRNTDLHPHGGEC
jgi:hypothetical protein